MRINRLIGTIRSRMRIDPAAVEGAGRFLIRVGGFLIPFLFLLTAWPIFAPERLLGIGFLLLIGVGVALAGLLLVRIIQSKPARFWWGVLLVAAMLFLTTLAGGVAAKGQAVLILSALLGIGLIGGCSALLRRDGLRWVAATGLVTGLGITLAIVVLAALPGWGRETPRRPVITARVPDLPNPGVAGAHDVTTMTYGSGTDRHRPEFGAGVTFRSRSVDGSRLLDGWEGATGWARTRYWGFDAKALPLNGRVWSPDGEGPFPVVLIVHGNHDMEDYSDSGYAWLGEHFASHGIFTVSVDENFLNSGFSDALAGFEGGLARENDARGWLLLEHLRQLREWNAARDHPLAGKLDLDRVVLIGHSRGGEAVAEAALFNRLPAFPDDARQSFDFGFGIQGLIAIAPIDGQYQPRARKTLVEDVSYLVIHGSLDGDVQSFTGAAQFARITFPQCSRCFKSGVYVIGANHGQFNTVWGRADSPMPGRLFLNLEPVMDGGLQREVARPLFTAFLLTTLFGRDEYREIFAAAPRSAPWVGQPVELISDYRAAGEIAIADFEDDANVATGSLAAVNITASGFTRWSEAEVGLKWGPLDSAAVKLGWDRKAEVAPPVWRIDFSASPPAFTALSFSLAMGEDSPLDDPGAAWQTPESLDLGIVVTDRSGQEARIDLAELGVLAPPVHAHTRKHPWLDGTATTEPLFTRYRIDAAQLAPLDLADIVAVEFRFDRSPRGLLWLDDLVLTPAPVPVDPFEVESGG